MPLTESSTTILGREKAVALVLGEMSMLTRRGFDV
jgi:hypothetical protein